MQTERIRAGKRFWLQWMLVMTLLALGLLLTGSVTAQEALPTLDDLAAGWNMLSPGGETICARGDPYHFFVHPGNNNKLMIFFEGGGACFDQASCSSTSTDPANDNYYDSSVSPTEADDNSGGILDFENSENPFQDYTTVFIAYCTGDVHAGNNVAIYGEGNDALTINHYGDVNATAALEWTYANVEAPESVFVAGCSAGAPGSIFHAPNIMAHYSDVPVTQMGDSDGFTRGGSEAISQWRTVGSVSNFPDLEDLPITELTMQMLYIDAAARYPNNVFSQVNTAHDWLQSRELEVFLQPNLSEIQAGAPNFRSYTGWGDVHCLTVNPLFFYTHQVNGLRLRDWVAALAAGEAVENVLCTDCETEEQYGLTSETLYQVNADGTELTPLIPDPEAWYWSASWSPDGSQIAIGITENPAQGLELYLLNADGSNPRPLTHNGRNNYLPAWSPDGEVLAFISQQGHEVNTAEIYTIRVDGTEETRLTDNDAWESAVSWSPDGQTIAFGSEYGGTWQIWLVNPDGSNQRPLATPAHGNWPTWSPDGQQMAFKSDRDGDDDIYIAQMDGSNERNITNNTAWDTTPAWSPDGSRIAFASYRDGTLGIYTMDVDGSSVVNLTPDLPLIVGLPTWSPDGKQLLFIARGWTTE